MRQVVLCIFLIYFSLIASSQVLRGRIVTSSGDPIPYSTIYIHENTTGIVADEKGAFQIKLKSGMYTCEFRCIGYDTQTKTVDVSSVGANIHVVLTEKTQNLKEVVVHVSSENPAYNVMRRAIARAPYHLYQVSAYSSENYLKGSAKIESIPTLMKMMIKDPKLKSLIGKLLVLESQNQITFRSPAIYTQHVIAYKSSIPKDMEPKGGIHISTSSIYESKYDGYISPLSPQAFRYYQFKLLDVFASGKNQVNKIRITPKLKNSQLFSGDIYILENDWSVFSLDLAVTEMGTTTRYKVNYQEVQPTVFMPITYEMYTNIGTMGVKGFARFYSSVKYTDIKISSSVPKLQPANSKSYSLTRKQTKAIETIDKLSAKEKLSTWEAIKIARLSSQLSEPVELRQQREALEIKDVQKVKMEVDSLASQRDSTFWEDIRNVPLQTDEAESFHRVDSFPASKAVKATNESIEISLGNTKKGSGWLKGETVILNKNVKLYYSGLAKGLLKEYNFVDGAWLGQKFSLSVDSCLYITPSVYYTTARKSVVWDVTSAYKYAPLSNGQLNLHIGNSSEDIQGTKGTSRFLNSISSLFAGDNVIRFYQNKYLKLENSVDIANGLRLTAGAGYENRQLLTNNTNFHIWGNDVQPNFPDADYSKSFPVNTATTGWLRVEYTPWYKYKIKNGQKEYVSSAYPTFGFEYKKAIPFLNQTEQASYDRLKLFISQNIKLTEFDKLYYSVVFGSFLTKKKMYAPDYNYFATSPLPVSFKQFENTFSLLDNYTYSDNSWLETHINWTSDYMLLKRIGFLQRFAFNESFQLNALWKVNNEKPYLEAGYSIGLYNMGRIGVFTGFTGFTFKSIGVKVSLPLFSMMGIQ
jgi:hypothetical protein